MTEPVLVVSGLRAYYRTSAFGVEREVRAVDDISLSIATNESLRMEHLPGLSNTTAGAPAISGRGRRDG